jgi:hypothetical protein
MKYIDSLSISDHKIKAHTELQLWVFGDNFECLCMGLILVQVPKTITPHKHNHVWPSHKFEQFQHQIPKRLFNDGVIWSRIEKHANYTKQHSVWLWGLVWLLKDMEVQLPCYFCILFILRCSCHPHTPRFLDPQKDSLLQRQKRTKMSTLYSCQNIQNNMKGHEQTNYQRNNFILRLSSTRFSLPN